MHSALDDPQHFEEVRECAICGRRERATRFDDPPFRVSECLHCGLVMVSPRLRSEYLDQVYSEDYWTSASPRDRGYADYRGDEALYLATFRMRWQWLSRFLPKHGRALDVGCAAGFFLSVLNEAGWEAHGVEPSATIARFATEERGLPRVHTGHLEEVDLEPGSFDLISFWDVVEHVADPIRLLERARRLLAPGGLIVIETQNVGSAFARLLGPRWHHYKHLEHLHHFEPNTLDRLLESAGLERVARTARYGGKHVSLGFVRERAGRVHPMLTRLLSPLRGLDARTSYVNLFDEMIVVARAARPDDEGALAMER